VIQVLKHYAAAMAGLYLSAGVFQEVTGWISDLA
jgi:hypothetical protein